MRLAGHIKALAVAVAIASALTGTVAAQQSTEDLAKAAQNPVAAMISLPFQSNTNFGYGPYDKTQEILNIQPVVPFSLTPDWNLITRVIAPVIVQPKLFPGDDTTFGLGDLNPTFFFSPSNSGKFVWGLGPVFLLPTATDDQLGTGKWGAGPSFVGLVSTGPWVVGALVNNIWSFAGDQSRPDVNQMTLQPFVNYNMKDGWYLSSSPIITANWEADNDNRWLVPVGGSVGRVFRVGKQAINASLGGYYNVISPDDSGPDWQIRAQVQFLFPK